MNPTRLASIERGLTGIARKVYEHVTTEERDLTRIVVELRNAGHNSDRSVVQGCLRSLVDNGLIREATLSGKSVWWREARKPETVQMELNKPVMGTVPAVPRPTVATPLDPLSSLGELAKRLRDTADQVEAIALEIEGRRHADREQIEKFQQLRTLLKGIS